MKRWNQFQRKIEEKNINIKDLSNEEKQKERVLEVVWNIKTDTFGFKILDSVYDPLGFPAPFILKGRGITQKLCQGNTACDDIASGEVQKECTKWRRCIKPANSGKVVEYSTHHFSDASRDWCVLVGNLRLVSNQSRCSTLCSTDWWSKNVSMPRLEQVAVTRYVKIALLLRGELDFEINKEYFWTDSKIVLLISAIQVKGSRSLSQTGFSSFVITQMLHSDTMFQLRAIQYITALEILMPSKSSK